MIFDDSTIIADARMEQVFEALKSNDQEAIVAMFSNQALSEADAFYDSLEALLQYVEGSILSWERTGGYGGKDEINAEGTGNRRKKTESRYNITTSEQEYHIAIYEYTIDTANPDNVGIYSICIISAEDYQETFFVFWGSGEAGINIGK